MRTTGANTNRGLRALVALLAVAAAVLAASAAPASAARPCWNQVLNDWFVNGEITGSYPIACYTEAQQHIPEDAKQYSNAPQAIQRALLAAIRQDRGNGPGGGIGGGGGGGGGGPIGGGGGGSVSNSAYSGAKVASPHQSPFTKVIDWLGPSNASSIPLPLLVLAGIALLLLAGAAASWFARRLQSRRLRPLPQPQRPPDQR